MSEKNYIFGLHAVETVLLKQPENILSVYLRKGQEHSLQKITSLLKKYAISHQWVERDVLDKLAQLGNHQGIVAQCSHIKTYTEQDLKNILADAKTQPFLLILDAIQDPHNLGACLRVADCAGVQAVIAPKDKSVGLTSTVMKVASGAAQTVPFVQVTNLARTLTWLKEQGIWLFGMADNAEKTLYEQDFNLPLGLVLGNEEKGMRKLTRDHCDVLLKIPMSGFVSSLNVSVAAGVALFEVVRQRN